MEPVLREPINSADVPDDRRRHKRFRFAAPISVRLSDGESVPAITLEISEQGLSAMASFPLTVGGTVQLESVTSEAIPAKVRHNVGKVYGFEFLQLSDEQAQRLKYICGRLPRYPPSNKMGI